MGYLIETVYFLTAVLFIVGLKRMSHPTTARSGIVWAGGGMVLATLVSFAHPQITAHISVVNYVLMVIAIAIAVFVLLATRLGSRSPAVAWRRCVRGGWHPGAGLVR